MVVKTLRVLAKLFENSRAHKKKRLYSICDTSWKLWKSYSCAEKLL